MKHHADKRQKRNECGMERCSASTCRENSIEKKCFRSHLFGLCVLILNLPPINPKLLAL